MRDLVSLVRFLLLLSLILATEALAGGIPSHLRGLHDRIIRRQGAAVVGTLEEMARQEPDSAAVHYLFGSALRGSADPAKVGDQEAQRLKQQAVDEQQVAVHLDPTFVYAWDEISSHFEESGDYERAAEAKLRQVRLEPDRLEHRGNYLNLLKKTGRPGVVLQALRAWVAEEPMREEAYSALGVYLEDAGKDDEAIEAYQRAVALGDGDWIPIRMGDLLAKQGRWEEAQDAYVHGCQGIEYPLSIYSRGVAYVKLGKVKLARRMLAILSNDEEPERGLIKRLRAVIQDPKIEPVLGLDAYKEP